MMNLFTRKIIGGLLLLPALAAVNGIAQQEKGFFPLFNGKNLENWDGNPKFWSVEDGAITGTTTKENPTKGNTFLLWRGGVLDDFELRLKVKIVGGNSGIQYRSEDRGDWVVSGYQADFDAGGTFSGILYHEKGRGVLAQRGQKTLITREGGKHKVTVVQSLGDPADILAAIRPEQWNDYKIIAKGYEFTHAINEKITVEVVDQDEQGRRSSGILALQLHAGPPMRIQFKDIRIKPLKGINVSGKWRFQVKTDQGTGAPEFDLKQKGERLTGTYTGLFGTQPITGTVKGNRLSMAIEGEYSGQTVVSTYEGKITSFRSMEGIVNFNEQIEATWTAKKH